jgi:hypothetical protein
MNTKKKQKTTISTRQRTVNVGVQSLYHGVFTTFQHHNDLSYNYEQKALIISLLTSLKLVKTPQNVSITSLTALRVLAGMQNSFPIGFL